MCVYVKLSVIILSLQNFYLVYGIRQGFCNQTLSSNFKTSCQLCIRNAYVECPNGSQKLTTGRGIADCDFQLELVKSKEKKTVNVNVRGCRHTCRRKTVIQKCCQGYWGSNCDACPGGGGDNACSRHGVCNDTLYGNGNCLCQDNFDGYACERCANDTLYGRQCNNVCQCLHGVCDHGVNGGGFCDCDSGYKGDNCDVWIPKCENKTCGNNSKCQDVHGYVMCACEHGYEKNSNGECIPIDSCTKDRPCDANATCTLTGPATYNCTCNNGYSGDGLVCDPIDPCQTNYGGCAINSSVCVYTGPEQSYCSCKEGYEEYRDEYGCTLIDDCAFNASHCDENAVCKTIAPKTFTCTCKDGYGGDGTVCFNNIVGLVTELDNNDPTLKGSMKFAKQLFKAVYSEELKYHGPFTMFLPTDRAFRTVLRKMSFRNFLANKNVAKQVLRQHMIVGELSLDDLHNATVVHTLQGNTAEITTRRRSGSLIYRYRLKGSGSKSSIVKGDIVAANGIVHVIGKLLTNPPVIPGHLEKTIWQLIKVDGRYNRMETLIATVGMEDEFAGENITIFAPNNAAWDELSVDALTYLQSNEGRDRLKVVLRNHIFSGIIDVMDLINQRRIRSMAGNEIEVYVSPLGQIRLNGNVNISQTDIPAQNGFYYHVESVILPDSLSNILPSFCDQRIKTQVTGSCSPCHAELVCPYPEDVPTDEISTECVFNYEIEDASGRRYIKINGCSRICNRTENVHTCCSGFYGSDCQPCRGGFKNPCNGNGQCFDGLNGDGMCKCNRSFTGPTCADCEDSNMFGPNCSTPCTCKYGICDNGIEGSGRCRKNTCRSGSLNGHLVHYTGPDCDVNLSQCPNGNILSCPAHSNCLKVSEEADDDIYQCVCQAGYEKIGEACFPIDPCNSSDRGGCHQQAKCVVTNPGQHYCKCEKGWVGNGEYCFPGTNCNRHRDCGSNAVCRTSTVPSDSLCTCIDGYHGNGTYCVPTNMCSVNNGDCDPVAECTPTGPGTNKCTCGEEYGGDGYTCYAAIGKLVDKFSDLSMVSGFLGLIPKEDNMLLSLQDNFTFFAPSNKAMRILMAKKPANFWNKNQDNIINFIRFHTIFGVKTTQIMFASKTDYGRYDTLYDGFKIHLYKKDNDFFVSSKKSNRSWSRIIAPNIPAFNGFIHVIDRALEPFFDNDETPFLEEFFDKHPEYSIFGEWLDNKGLMETLMDMDEYTLFVPSNRIVENFLNTTKITKDFLKYYILPNIRLSMSFENQETIETLLGARHKLSFIVWTRQVFVNEVEIKKPDMLTDAGVIHGIDGPLVPTLHRCDEKLVNTTWSECQFCRQRVVCPPGYHVAEPIQNVQCFFKIRQDINQQFIGCKATCETVTKKEKCCSGFYGPHCLECPGGQEFPCNNNGACNDGLNGTGVCSCFEGFEGEACEICVSRDNKYPCSKTCSFNNGGCSHHAECLEVEGTTSCHCKLGYIGDGFSCDNPCDVNNGGCHENATCVFQDGAGINCTCIGDASGDGFDCFKSTNVQTGALSSSKISVGWIIGPVVAVILTLVICVTIIYYIYKKSEATGIVDMWQKLRKGSDSSMSFARLHTIQDDDDDDLITEPSSISSDINFGNPIFSSDKIQYSDDDN